MTRHRLLFLSALASISSLAFASSAHAEALVQLVYHAPAECPSQIDFVAAVASRGGRFDAPEPSSRLRGLEISIHRSAQGFQGSLRLEESAGTSAVREVHAAECAEVANGLAIVTAIALSGSNQATPPEAAPAKPPSEPVAALATRAPPVTPEPAPKPKLRLSANSFKRDPEVQVGPGTLRFDRVRTYTLSAGADFGLLPGLVLPRYEFATGVANFVTPPALASYLVGPVLEAEWSFLGPGTVHNKGYATRAIGFHAGLRSCSGFPYDTRGLTLLLCGEFGLGGLHVVTKDAQGETVQTKESGFGTAGLGLDTRYSFGSIWQLGLRLGGRLQLGSLSAERRDGTEIFAAPLFGAYALAGLGLQF